ncbi:MAG: glutamate 5-kinase [Pseudomonadota bacterium]
MGTLVQNAGADTEDCLAVARRLVVKIGSALLVDPENGVLRRDWLAALAQDIATLRREGRDVVVVSSGAIALGRRVLDFGSGALSLEQSQAAAAIGQTRLVQAWEQALSAHGIMAAQVLLTLEDTERRRRYLNGRATLAALLNVGAVPVVNENDTVATDEIRYGDNDRLAARVALMSDADTLVLLSDIDGLYTANPRDDTSARHIDEVTEITPEIEAMAGGTGTVGAKGGMKTKLQAAQIAMQGGCAMIVTRGETLNPLAALRDGARATRFLPLTEPTAARKRWIAGMKSRGRVHIDAGAVNALRNGKSLLAAGVRQVDGDFQRGDPVEILDPVGAKIASALIGYNADDARAIAGVRSDRIGDILGYPVRAALVHRDDMVIWGTDAHKDGRDGWTSA